MKALRSKDVKVNGKRKNKDCLCYPNDEIEVYLPADLSPSGNNENARERKTAGTSASETTDGSLPERNAVETIYADENVVVAVKPQGVPFEEFAGSVSDKHKGAEAVHRLDVNTFGLMIFALNETAKNELEKGFKDRTFDKYYIAEVAGNPNPPSAVLTAYLQKDSAKSTVYVHSKKQPGDVEIITEYKKTPRFCEFYGGFLRLTDNSQDGNSQKSSFFSTERGEEINNSSLVEVKLVTGKTHQIRAHLAFAGMPIIGDDKYGNRALNRQAKVTRQRLCSYKIVLHFKNDSPLAYLDGKTFTYFDTGRHI